MHKEIISTCYPEKKPIQKSVSQIMKEILLSIKLVAQSTILAHGIMAPDIPAWIWVTHK